VHLFVREADFQALASRRLELLLERKGLPVQAWRVPVQAQWVPVSPQAVVRLAFLLDKKPTGFALQACSSSKTWAVLSQGPLAHR
jgi:hypothetical protein